MYFELENLMMERWRREKQAPEDNIIISLTLSRLPEYVGNALASTRRERVYRFSLSLGFLCAGQERRFLLPVKLNSFTNG